MILSTPKKICASNISEALYVLQHIFRSKGKKISDTKIDLCKTKKVDLLGLLCIFKALEFSLQKNSFANPTLIANTDSEIMLAYRKFRLFDLFRTLINQNNSENKKKIKEYHRELNKLVPITTDSFILSPQVLVAGKSLSKTEISSQFLPAIQSYYKDEKVIRMIFGCLSEVMLNFWKHANGDDSSVVMAHGNSRFIEICCVDIGIGVISSMKEQYTKRDEKLLAMCVQKGVTSKPGTDHMGKGLWILDRTSTLNGGRFILASEGWLRDNNCGKVIVKETGYWKGAIIYINLRIDRPVGVNSFMAINQSLFANE